MKDQCARAILKSLIDGNDPISGGELPVDSLLQNAAVLRALLIAVDSLKGEGRRSARRRSGPPNVGKPWTKAEVAKLLEALRSGESLENIAQHHGRSVRAIQSRLRGFACDTSEVKLTMTIRT